MRYIIKMVMHNGTTLYVGKHGMDVFQPAKKNAQEFVELRNCIAARELMKGHPAVKSVWVVFS